MLAKQAKDDKTIQPLDPIYDKLSDVNQRGKKFIDQAKSLAIHEK